MKKSNITVVAASLVALAAVTGLAVNSFAAEDNGLLGGMRAKLAGNSSISRGMGTMMGERVGIFANLTDEEKTAAEAKMEAVNQALTDGNYDAWVAAVKAIDEDSPLLSKMTKENFETYANRHQERQADMTENQAKMDAVRKAIEDGNFDAWVAAVKAIDEDAQILEKINAGNFSRFVEAHSSIENGRAILEELGVEGMGLRGGKAEFGIHKMGGRIGGGMMDGTGTGTGMGMGMGRNR